MSPPSQLAMFFLLPIALALVPVASAQFTNVTCLSTTDWTYNSRGQNPCLVAAYLQGACLTDPSWSVWTLSRSNITYGSPTADQATICTCSSVVFSLISACAYCQGANIPYWSEWTLSCPTADISNGQYPHALPQGTAVSAWAYVPITSDLWVVGQAESLASTSAAESSAPGGPSATIDQSSSSSSSATASSASASATASTKKSSNTGPIVGGVVGGILGLAILGVAGFFVYRYFKNKEQQAKAQPFYGNHIDPPYPTEGKMSVPPLSPNEFNPLLVNQPPMKIYNPEDPSTFPTFAANTPSVSTYPSSQAALIPNRSPPPIEV